MQTNKTSDSSASTPIRRLASASALLAMLGGCVDEPLELDESEEVVQGTATIASLHGERDVTYLVVDGHAILEGDIDLGPVDENGDLVRLRGAALANESLLWPGGEIPYNYRVGLLNPSRVADAIAIIEDATSIRFRPKEQNDTHWITFGNSALGYSRSDLGRVPNDYNDVELTSDASVGTVIHEILHSLGFNHEQTRSDWWQYIDINYNCIDDDVEANFYADEDLSQVNLEPYDFDSIMHYGAMAFCNGWEDGVCDNPSCVPITYAGTSEAIDQPTTGLTSHDINSIYRVYHNPVGANEPGDQFGSAVAHGDFDGDGYDDLAVGVPLEELGVIRSGAVSLFKGNSVGQITPWESLDQTGLGDNEEGDKFGAALAVGDFNGDGIDDLAVGAPNEDVNGVVEAGAVFVFTGSKFGLEPWRLIHQATSPALGYNETGDHFGTALAAGDFDDDDADDLAVGAPDEDIESLSATLAGSVFVYEGSSSGLTPWVKLDQSSLETDETGDRFGAALAVGRFDSNEYDDLVIGSPEHTSGGGSVFVFEGSSTGLVALDRFTQADVGGLNENDDRFGAALAVGRFRAGNTDDLAVGAPGEDVGSSPNVQVNAGQVYMFKSWGNSLVGWHNFGQSGLGADEAGDAFGSSLAAGEVWRTSTNNWEDLVVGAPDEDVNPGSGNVTNTGIVFVYSGGDTNMVGRIAIDEGDLTKFVTNNGFTPGLDAGDDYGRALTIGDFDGDGDGDLVVGIPMEDSGEGAVVHFHYPKENTNNVFEYVTPIQQSLLQEYDW